MTKKDKKQNKYTSAPTEPTHLDVIKDRPSHKDTEPLIKTFDSLDAFESYLKDETWDNEFDFLHAKVNYYPPFVMHECHDDLDKVKPTMTNLNKKFVRNLHHHIDRHLLKEISKWSGVDYEFGKGVELHKGSDLIWHFTDDSNHGYQEESMHGRKWKMELDVTCHSDNPEIIVDMKTIPID